MRAQEAGRRDARAGRGDVRGRGPLMLDTVREIHTPEGVALRLPAAGPVPRALAWLIDLSIRSGLLLLAATVFALLGRAGMGLYLVLLFLVVWAYPVVFEATWHGQTPGKRAMGLRVVSADGAPVGWMASFLRNLMRTVDMLPFGYAFGLASSLADPWSRRLGDIVARTMVVHAPGRGHGAALPPATAVAPAVPLLPGEQAALIAFAERAHTLTPQRQEELAGIAAPLTGMTGEAGVWRLSAIAQWLLGRRA